MNDVLQCFEKRNNTSVWSSLFIVCVLFEWRKVCTGGLHLWYGYGYVLKTFFRFFYFYFFIRPSKIVDIDSGVMCSVLSQPYNRVSFSTLTRITHIWEIFYQISIAGIFRKKFVGYIVRLVNISKTKPSSMEIFICLMLHWKCKTKIDNPLISIIYSTRLILLATKAFVCYIPSNFPLACRVCVLSRFSIFQLHHIVIMFIRNLSADR